MARYGMDYNNDRFGRNYEANRGMDNRGSFNRGTNRGYNTDFGAREMSGGGYSGRGGYGYEGYGTSRGFDTNRGYGAGGGFDTNRGYGMTGGESYRGNRGGWTGGNWTGGRYDASYRGGEQNEGWGESIRDTWQDVKQGARRMMGRGGYDRNW